MIEQLLNPRQNRHFVCIGYSTPLSKALSRAKQTRALGVLPLQEDSVNQEVLHILLGLKEEVFINSSLLKSGNDLFTDSVVQVECHGRIRVEKPFPDIIRQFLSVFGRPVAQNLLVKQQALDAPLFDTESARRERGSERAFMKTKEEGLFVYASNDACSRASCRVIWNLSKTSRD